MSDFEYQPAYGMNVSKQPRTLTNKFGDGYEQRAADGINNKLRTYSLSFSRVTADVEAIETFLDGKGGVTSFTWTPSGGSEVRVICREWGYSFNSNNTRVLNCTFEEVVA
jgi:phage-related protein